MAFSQQPLQLAGPQLGCASTHPPPFTHSNPSGQLLHATPPHPQASGGCLSCGTQTDPWQHPSQVPQLGGAASTAIGPSDNSGASCVGESPNEAASVDTSTEESAVVPASPPGAAAGPSTSSSDRPHARARLASASASQDRPITLHRVGDGFMRQHQPPGHLVQDHAGGPPGRRRARAALSRRECRPAQLETRALRARIRARARFGPHPRDPRARRRSLRRGVLRLHAPERPEPGGQRGARVGGSTTTRLGVDRAYVGHTRRSPVSAVRGPAGGRRFEGRVEVSPEALGGSRRRPRIAAPPRRRLRDAGGVVHCWLHGIAVRTSVAGLVQSNGCSLDERMLQVAF